MPDPISLHTDLPWYIKAFFDAQPRLSAGEKKVFAGVYGDNAGTSFTEYGVAKTPAYLLKVGAQEATSTGSEWTTTGITLDGAGSRLEGFVYLQELGDAVADNAETLGRILGPYNQEGENGPAWATAISGDAQRATRFNKKWDEITDVPAGAPSQDATALQSFLHAHFTYDSATKQYFSKWSGSGRSFPADTSPAYRQKAVVEYKLQRDRFYVYSLITEATATGGTYPATEAITVLNRDGDNLSLNVVYACSRREAAQHREFTFFHSASGLGVRAPAGARGTLDGSLVDLVRDGNTAEILATAQGNTGYSVENEKVVVFGTVAEGADFTSEPLPEGVQMDNLVGSSDPQMQTGGTDSQLPEEERDPGTEAPVGRTRVFQVPPDKMVDLAAHPKIEVLEPARVEQFSSEVARTNVNHARLLSDLGVSAGDGGEGVYVGIIDTGVDGSHPAFAGRIHKVWDMKLSPTSSNGGPTRYPTQGRIYSTQADITSLSTDANGHGTHVAGIAAGAATAAYPHGGMAPKAKLLVAAATNTSWGFPSAWTYRAIRWMMDEAGSRPLVINMSFGGHGGHGHDGLDSSGLAKRDLIRYWLFGNRWLDGRILVGAAGNAGGFNGHIHTAALAAGRTATWALRNGRALSGGTYDINIFGRPTPNSVRGGSFDIRVRRPGTADDTGWVSRDLWNRSNSTVSTFTGTRIAVINQSPQPYSGHARAIIRFAPNAAPGGLAASNWQIMIRNTLGHEMEVHGYSEAVLQPSSFPGLGDFFFPAATQRSTIGSPASAHGILAVGSSVNRATYNDTATPPVAHATTKPGGWSPTTNQPTGWVAHPVGEQSWTSCMGPIRGSRRTLATVAPGRAVVSADSSQKAHAVASKPSAHSVVKSGTSMAAPVVTGLIACLLEKQPNLDYMDVRARLRRAATVPSGWDRTVWGPGLINAANMD